MRYCFKVWNEKKEKNDIRLLSIIILETDNMTKKAIITISLVPQASEVSNSQLKEDIRKSLKCDWLAEVERVTVKKGC